MATPDKTKEPTFIIDNIPLEEHEVEVPLFEGVLTDAEKRQGTPDEIKQEVAERAWKAYVDYAVKKKSENPGLMFKHVISPKEGYMWMVAYYNEEFIYTPAMIKNDIANLDRESKNIIVVARDSHDAAEARKLVAERFAELRRWIRDYRNRIYHLVRRDVASATTFFLMMPESLLRKVMDNLVKEANKKVADLRKNTEECKKREGAILVPDTRRIVERAEQPPNAA